MRFSSSPPRPSSCSSTSTKRLELCWYVTAALILSLTTASVGLFLSLVATNEDYSLAAGRNLLLEGDSAQDSSSTAVYQQRYHNDKASAPTSSTTKKKEEVTFRAMQPDGSLAVQHVVLDTSVVDRRNEEREGAVIIKPRHNNLRSSVGRHRHLIEKQIAATTSTASVENEEGVDDDDDDDEQLDFYRKTIPIPVKPIAFGRRLLSIGSDDVQQSVSTPLTVVEENSGDNSGRYVEVIPAILVGIASAVIACAVVLLVADLRDRRRYEETVKLDRALKPQQALANRDNESDMPGGYEVRRSKSFSRNREKRSTFVGACHNQMLPPLQEQREVDETIINMSLCKNIHEVTVSPMTTMSGSASFDSDDKDQVLLGTKQMAAAEKRYEAEVAKHAPSWMATELSEMDRVNDCSDLGCLILNRTATSKTESFASGSSGISADGNDNTKMAKMGSLFVGKYLSSSLGETVVKAANTGKHDIRAPPNTPTAEEPEERDDTPTTLYADGPEEIRLAFDDDDDYSGKTEDFIRDIYFVPSSSSTGGTTMSMDGKVSLFGVKFGDAFCSVAHPEVLGVQPNSPLYQRLFPGDFLLGINGADTAGLSAFEVADLMTPSCCNDNNVAPRGFIKFTVMSANADGWSDSGYTNESSSSNALNSLSHYVGLPDTAVEI